MANINSSIEKLITSFSNEHLKEFFFKKIDSFSPDADLFYNILDEKSNFEHPVKIGHAELGDSNELLVFTCAYKGELTQRSAKKRQFEIAKKVLSEDFKDGAIFVFYDESGNFRLSFIRRYYGKDQKYSNWKRFTYYVRPDKQNKTFKKQLERCDFSSLDEIEAAFNVEALSKEFYTELSHWYFASLNEVEFPNEFDENRHQLNSQAMIRLITRMMFVWFMKQKGLIPNEIFDKKHLDEVLKYDDQTGSTYYKAILQNLFFATLNTEMGEKRKWVTSKAYGVQHFYRYQRFFTEEGAEKFINLMQKIPFLNGGLFENLDIVETADKEKDLPKRDIRIDCFSDNPKNENRLKVPDYLFFGTREADLSALLDDQRKNRVQVEGLIDLLNRYDFTIDENSPDDQEVALDPELLGTVFENLLASYNPETQSTARKESGSFYTPRPIVDYMVKESLFYYLQDKSEIEEEKLRLLLEGNETDQLSENEKRTLVQLLTHIKILDPACGSGAFPMGALQQMVRMLNLLDPGNTIYKEELQEKLKQELQSTIDQSDFEELKTNIEEVFANQYNDPDYARKLFLIQNCLYGVDIQSIAMQITKLRFFISLLVEQQIDKNQDNYGVMPLPNLETKFVAANTLIGLDKQEGELKSLFIQEKEEELAEVREKYFNARSYPTKRKHRVKDKELREEIAQLLISDGWANETAKQISNWDPFNQNSSSDWFDPEWMFGVDKFDLVIGNPPYIKENNYKEVFEGFRESKYYKGKMDLWYGFSCISIDLLKDKGFLCFIAQNNWVTNFGASIMRDKVINDTKIKSLIDFNHYMIFESADTQTMIMIFQKDSVSDDYSFDYRKLHSSNNEFNDVIDILNKKKNNNIIFKPTINRNALRNNYILFSDEKTEPILFKIFKRNNFQLTEKEVANGIHSHHEAITNRMASNFPNLYEKGDGVFVINNEEKVKLNLLESEKNIIKPFYDSKNLKRYYGNAKNEKWIIYTNSLFKDPDSLINYPNIKRHLDKYQNIITSSNKPYGLLRARGESFFIGEKIMSLRKCSDRPTFTYTDFDCYVPASYYIIKSHRINQKYLTALLNSDLIMFWLLHKGKMQGTNFQIDKQPILELPIFKPKNEIQENASKIVTKILTKKENNEDTTLEENEIDVMVYKLYELSYDEVKIVDPEFWMSEEEYEAFEIKKADDSLAN